jgi:hypothetical protein
MGSGATGSKRTVRAWRWGAIVPALALSLAACQNFSSFGAAPKATQPPNAASPNPSVPPQPANSASPQPSQPPRQQLEAALTKLLNDSTGVAVAKLTCPERNALKPGDKFECDAVADNQTFAIAVEITDEQGQFNWTSKNLVQLSKLESFIADGLKKSAGGEPKVDCGGKLKRVLPGDKIACKLLNQGKTENLEIVVKDDQGNVELVPPGAAKVSPGASPDASPGASPSASSEPSETPAEANPEG